MLYLAMEMMHQEEDHFTYGPTGILLKMKGGAISNYTRVIDIKQDVWGNWDVWSLSLKQMLVPTLP